MVTTVEATPVRHDRGDVANLLRIAGPNDVGAMLALARLGGTGLTNLPANRKALLKRLEASAAASSDVTARENGAGIIFVVEGNGGAILATSAVFPRVGVEWPFYSYRMVRQTRDSRAAARRTEQTLLMLTNDFDGEAEVGALFVAPSARHLALGSLAARSRYLFIAQHRSWFGERVIAELRGWQDHTGCSPVWDSVGRHFYGMTLAEADRFGSVRGNQFIADLGPRHPIYTSLLPEAARMALGRPHDDGQPAYAMLLREGFVDQGYVDIFDGGPTPVASIDRLETVRGSRLATLTEPSDDLLPSALVAAGQGPSFRVLRTGAMLIGAELAISRLAAHRLGLEPGDVARVLPLATERLA